MRFAPHKKKGEQNTLDQEIRVAACVLVLVTLVLYWPVRQFEFINFDDDRYVTENVEVLRGINPEGIVWAFTSGQHFMWHPLTTLSHMLDVSLFGLNAGAHHLINLLLHAGNTVLLLLLLWRVTREFWPSVLIAGLFAWHPLRVESVAWISERKDVLSGGFWLLTLLAYVSYVAKPTPARYWRSVGVYALAILTKPMVVMLPLTLLLLDYWPLNRLQFDRGKRQQLMGLLKEKLPFALLSAALAVITILSQKSGDAVKTLEEFPMGERLANAVISYCRYLGKIFWPTDLSVFYPHPGKWPALAVVGAVLLIAGITIMAWRWRRPKPWFMVGWLWFLGTLVPVIGILQSGAQAMADRYTYIPAIGITLMLVWGVARSSMASQVALMRVGSGLLLGACLVISHLQLRHWQNSELIFRQALKATDDSNSVACLNLATALIVQARFAEAAPYLEKTVVRDPTHATAWYNWGLALSNLGEHQEAIAKYEKALALDPGMAYAGYNLGLALMETGRPAEAEARYRNVLGQQSDFVPAQVALAYALDAQQKNSEAVSAFQKAIQMARETGQLELAGNIETALAAYQSGNNLRMSPQR